MLSRATWRTVWRLNWKGSPAGSTKSPFQMGCVLAIQLGLQKEGCAGSALAHAAAPATARAMAPRRTMEVSGVVFMSGS
ncbi:hypothetical protein GCM10027082_09660 [Comamonas humi]